MPSPIEQWYRDVPPITRLYLTAAVAVTLAVHLDAVNMFQLYYDFEHTFQRGQLWRLFTTVFYFGPFSFNWALHIFFLVQYMRDLEEGSFGNQSADFLWFLGVACACLLTCSSVAAMPFLAPALSFTVIYVWSRRNPNVQLNLMGLFTFRAPYFPLVMLGLSYLLNNELPVQNVCGLVVGHLYYFLEDVWPLNPASHGQRWLQTPVLFSRLVSSFLRTTESPGQDELVVDEPDAPLPPLSVPTPSAAEPAPALTVRQRREVTIDPAPHE